ncbi:MAG TPA: DUF1232 domain-containing protein [Kineosporiaceae bacterium]|nr:DUF1232 domain-containing protein [Kineosporiaceae bacterium]
MWWRVVAGVVAGLLLAYAIGLAVLWRYARTHPETVSLRDAFRLLPDLVRLFRRLAADRALPLGVRVRLVLLLVYLASPIDLVPDVVPVLGYADDAIVVALVLRSVVRRAGPDALRQHWPGTEEGLAVLLHVAGMPFER